jgi:hypothetical protein
MLEAISELDAQDVRFGQGFAIISHGACGKIGKIFIWNTPWGYSFGLPTRRFSGEALKKSPDLRNFLMDVIIVVE